MKSIAKPLLKWFDIHGRNNLPWQSKPANPYFIWLSEVMLQQTQVVTVVSYFNNFAQHFPDLQTLANADEDLVLAQWAGLGYYARARNLHKTAKIIVEQYQGHFPTDFEQVLALPGVGRSTASAILSLSFNQNHAILDGNVKRVLSRYHQVKGDYGQSTTLNELWRLAKMHTPNIRNANYTQAIMDLGAMLCTRSNPDCKHCPITGGCQANKHATQMQYPHPKPKRIKPTKKIAMLVFINKKDKIYLQKRPTKGIWGGLWGLVECADKQSEIQKTMMDFHPQASIRKNLSCFKHSFTHYHLHISPVVVNCPNNNKDFHSLSQLNIGLPVPVQKIIKQLR